MEFQLSIEEKRKTIFSSLLRYQSDIVPLRQRVLDRVVLGALIGSTEDLPYRVGKIRSNLTLGTAGASLRDVVIQDSLEKLIQQGKVVQGELLKRHAYFLSESGLEEVNSQIQSVSSLFDSVLTTLLKDTENLVSFQVASGICRKFIFECFARYGQVIAKQVVGLVANDGNHSFIDINTLFEISIRENQLSKEAKDSLKARCINFLKSKDPDTEKLKFFLSQGYYFTQLLGVEYTHFDPLNEEAFNGSCFYIDTNVLLLGMLEVDEDESVFDELLNIARRLKIEIRITSTTIAEAVKVTKEKFANLAKIVDIVPPELLEKTKDKFLTTFLETLENHPDKTIEEFFAPFEDLPKYIKERWGINITEVSEQEILGSKDHAAELDIINDAAEDTRHFGKPEGVLLHDLIHYLLVKSDRIQNSKTWFLTRDRTLIEAAQRLETTNSIFTFPLIGFLHSISPFVTVSSEEESFADVLSGLFTEQMFSMESVFDVKELALIAEYHEDVMSTPGDDLVMAFDYIKTKVLEGKQYSRDFIPDVSLELKKFLTISKDERIEALRTERERIEREHSKAVQNIGALTKDNELIKNQLEQVNQEKDQQQRQIDSLNHQFGQLMTKTEKDARKLWFALMVVGSISASLLWAGSSFLASNLSFIEPVGAVILINIVAILLFTLPAAKWIELQKWSSNNKQIIIIVLIILVLLVSRFLDDDKAGILANYIEIGSIIGLGLYLVLQKRKFEST